MHCLLMLISICKPYYYYFCTLIRKTKFYLAIVKETITAKHIVSILTIIKQIQRIPYTYCIHFKNGSDEQNIDKEQSKEIAREKSFV